MKEGGGEFAAAGKEEVTSKSLFSSLLSLHLFGSPRLLLPSTSLCLLLL